MMAADLSSIGVWASGPRAPAFDPQPLVDVIHEVRRPMHVVRDLGGGRLGVAVEGQIIPASAANGHPTLALMGSLPALYPEWLGDRSFNEVHQVRFPYVAGAMANGIATTELVIAMAQAGMLSFFGAAGLTRDRVSAALDELQATLGHRYSWGSNLIHSPNEPDLEAAIADLYIQRDVRRVSASAYMGLTPAIVRYASTGLSIDASGNIQRKNYVFAKISRPEVARRFMAPAPKEILDQLVGQGMLTADEASLAAHVPVAEDYTVEADSGGHTDNQTLTAVFPVVLDLRDAMTRKHGYARPIRIGAGGGIGTPSAVAAAFSLGAAYVLTGSVNQGAVESGLSDEGRKLLAQADMGDVMMAPAADMFELGVKVQVLKRGTMFAVRAQQLYDHYVAYDGIEFMPDDVRTKLERNVLGATCDEIWAGTREFFLKRDTHEVERAERDPKHRMALVCRWYLGLSSRWAIAGDPVRRMDYQIWCGPAMGAFNDWVKGSFLEAPESRKAVQIARNLLEGAAVVTRAQQLRSYGVPVPPAAFHYPPRPLSEN